MNGEEDRGDSNKSRTDRQTSLNYIDSDKLSNTSDDWYFFRV